MRIPAACCLQGVVSIFLFAANVSAQGVTSSITGVVTDASQAVVVGAKVTVRNLNTGVANSAETNSSGVYNIPSLASATYELRIEASGFKTFVQSNVILDVGRVLRLDVPLQLGVVGESITVLAESPLLQTETSSTNTQVTSTQLNTLPFQLAGSLRDPTSFVRLTPGATGGAFGANITGGRAFASEVLIDGVPTAYNAATNSPDQARPAYDTVSEFRVEAVIPPAEYGRTSGGVVTMVTRSGTNELHGNLTMLLRNNILDARRYNALIADVTRQSEFAGSIGGPVVIPKLYNGRNRTFFFGNYTGFRRINIPQGLNATVGTDRMRVGDFTEVLSGANPRLIYDPLTTSGSSRMAFPGNVIPSNRIVSFARSIHEVIPGPNAPGLANNYQGEGPATQPTDTFLVKIDHQISDKNRFSGTVRYQNPRRTFSRGPLPQVSDGFKDNPKSANVVLSDDYIIRPNLVNRIQAGYTRFGNPTASSQDIGLQVPGAFAGGFPAVRFNTQGLTNIADADFRYEGDNNYDIQESMTWTTGKHTFKFGARFDHFQFNFRPFGNEVGTYFFSEFATGQPNASTTGHAYASFLLGLVNNASMSKGTPYGLRSNYVGLFFQDDWKLTRKLTVNYGVRWEIQNPWYEVVGRTSLMDPLTPNPGAGGRPGALIFGDENRRGFQQTYFGGIGPRLGIAYQLTQRTVLRTGYGMFYAPIIGNNLNLQGYTSAIGVSSLDGGYTPVFGMAQGWPSSLVRLPPFIDPTVANNQATSIAATCRGCGSRLPRTSQWQLGIQHTVRNLLLDASYVGTVAHGIINNALSNINQAHPQYLSLGDLLRANINSPAVAAAGFAPPYPGFTGTLAQALRTFPQYQELTDLASPTGNSSYHAFLFKAERRFANGLQFLVSYSFSKTLSDVAFDANGVLARPQDQFNRRAEKSLANTDRPQRFVSSFVYEMPWGPGKPFLKTGIWSQILGGFAVSGILEYQRAGPLRVTVPNALAIFNGHLRPNRVSGVPIRIGPGFESFEPFNSLTGQQGDLMLDRSAFSTPNPHTFGNLGVFLPDIRGFSGRVEDISVMKRHRFMESRVIELRADFFNAFNRRNLNNPITDLSNPNFGRITGQGNPRAIQLGFRLDF